MNHAITITVAHAGQATDFPISGLGKDAAAEVSQALKSGALHDLVLTGEANTARLSMGVLRGLTSHPILKDAAAHAAAIAGDEATARARLEVA